jgi:type II secretory ATPase GspE/PulE/Tfp pilus assembly ATPase PilB-like protein
MIEHPLRTGSVNQHEWLQELLCRQVEPGHCEPGSHLPEDFSEAWEKACEILGQSSEQLLQLISQHYGFEIAQEKDIDPAAMALVPARTLQEYGVIPMEEDGKRLVLAVSNPFDLELIKTLTFVSNHHLILRIAAPEVLEQWIKEKLVNLGPIRKGSNQQRPSTATNNQSLQVSDSAIAKLVNDMIVEAYQRNASDIHIEPFFGAGEVRYRIDGLLTRISTLPKELFEHMLRRIKVIGKMDITNALVTQDGHASLDIDGNRLDLRISTIPVVGGEKVVVRLLKQTGVVSLDSLGITDHELSILRRVLSNQSGIFIMTGPTGSGKTTTLYSALAEINTFERCLVTVEDPVEYKIEGIAQINVNRSMEVTFANALRSILRQDPDVVLVGEIRDEETANITLRAALTGHFVMSTLHTRDAVTTISRLLDLGVSEQIIADSLSGLAAQRLLRKLCPHCTVPSKAESSIEQEYLERYPGVKLMHGKGCKQCGSTGYSGRFPILELLVVKQEISDAIRQKKPLGEIRRIAVENGMRTLPVLAKEAIAQGRTSVAEAHRVIGEELWGDM